MTRRSTILGALLASMHGAAHSFLMGLPHMLPFVSFVAASWLEGQSMLLTLYFVFGGFGAIKFQ